MRRQSSQRSCRLFSLIGLAVIALAGLRTAAGAAESPCTYYASPAGKGNGRSPQAAFPIASFWPKAAPGDTLCLEDGIYRGAGSMISPPQGLSGRPQTPITIRALNDGKVLLDGENSKEPIHLWHNDWFVIDGVNACCSSNTVVNISRSSHNIIRRVAAWDAAEGNNDIFGIHDADHNLLEDVAGWGIARKTYESSQGGDFTTIRRGWGRWEGSHVIGPKMVYALAYNNYDMLVENSIGTWSGEKMKRSYTLLDYSGKPWVGPGEGTYQDHDVDQPYGIFGIDRLDRDKNARARLLGSIAYVAAADSFKARYLIFVTKVDSVEIADTVAYIEPGSDSRPLTFGLFRGTGRGREAGLSVHNITSFGGAGTRIAKDWNSRNVLEAASSVAYDPKENIFNTNRGSNLCHQYVGGVRTSQPLWPWPMNQRIIDAMIQSGRQPMDVTATVERLFGPIPSPCRAQAAQGSTPGN